MSAPKVSTLGGERRGSMSTAKTIGIAVLVVVIAIILFSVIGWVFSLVRIVIEAAIIVGICYVAYLAVRRSKKSSS
jgi:threonine/homoserine/homoserine lactone efflux protein